MPGTRKFTIDGQKKAFVEAFYPRGSKAGTQLDLKQEKILADLVFVDMFQQEELIPSRFRQCDRWKCGKYFYQPTSKARRFCSAGCANAVRQERYRKDHDG